MKNRIKIGDYDIDIVVEHEKDGTYASATCPICGHIVDSHDHGFGADHAIRITIGKMKTHMALVHNIKNEE